MATAKEQLERARRSLAAQRADKKEAEEEAIGHLAALGGGLAGSVVHRYLPAVVPGAAIDGPALAATALVFDGIAMWSGSRLMLAFSYAYEGYLSGKALDHAMGWTPPMVQKL